MPSSVTCYAVGQSRTGGRRHSTSGFIITPATSPSCMTLWGGPRQLVGVASVLRSRGVTKGVADQQVALARGAIGLDGVALSAIGLSAIDLGAIGIEIAAGTGRRSLRRERAGRARGRP